MKTFPGYSISSSTAYKKAAPAKGIIVYLTGRTLTLKPEEITCLEGEGNYTFIYTRRGIRYLVSRTLKSLTEELNDSFLRIHKSYIINTNSIAERLEDDRIIRLSCGKEAMVSRRKVREIAEILNGYENLVTA